MFKLVIRSNRLAKAAPVVLDEVDTQDIKALLAHALDGKTWRDYMQLTREIAIEEVIIFYKLRACGRECYDNKLWKNITCY